MTHADHPDDVPARDVVEVRGDAGEGTEEPEAVRPDEILSAEEAARRGGEQPIRSARTAAWRELLRFLPDVGRLLGRLARDGRVPWHAKAVAAGAVTYVLSPVDLLPDFLPAVGQMDDMYIVTKALRYLFNTAGYDVVREHWTGSDDGFALLLVVAGIDR